MDETIRPSPLAVAVLSLLHAGPLHPYAMQRLIKLWGKDRVVNVGQRANLYKTIRRLEEAGLVAVLHTERDQRYPERTVYQLTEAGRAAAGDWLARLVAVPRNEFPQFPAALSFLMLLGPEQALAALEQRAQALAGTLAAIDADLAQYAGTLPRVTLMDDEYRRAVTDAELAWLQGVIEDLRTGALTWNYEMFAEIADELPGGDVPGGGPG
ncbi:MAG TPA: PadR family transcriptional regulator [Streptosporangiaceae bacterium]|nr:PadR family transcriptional regulator [Streptosporangiaceae bacterium]